MRLRWGLSERSPGGPKYRAPYGAKNAIMYLVTRPTLNVELLVDGESCT